MVAGDQPSNGLKFQKDQLLHKIIRSPIHPEMGDVSSVLYGFSSFRMLFVLHLLSNGPAAADVVYSSFGGTVLER